MLVIPSLVRKGRFSPFCREVILFLNWKEKTAVKFMEKNYQKPEERNSIGYNWASSYAFL